METQAETKTGLVKDFDKTFDELGKKARECDALRAKVGKLDEGFAALREAPSANEKKLEKHESRVGLNVKTIGHLATLVKDCYSNKPSRGC